MSRPKIGTMVDVEITQTVARFGRADYGNVVYGIMKGETTVLGKFTLSIPYRNTKWRGPYWVIIWDFEISPEHRQQGFGRVCYGALEKMIVEKYNPQAIYLQYLVTTNIAGQISDSKGFWEKLGYKATQGQSMRKRLC